MPRGPFHPSKCYEYAGDLREYGFDARLSLYCLMDKVGNHKLELIDVGKRNRGEILRQIGELFEVNPRSLGVMRVDFAVDVPRLPIQWFRETVKIDHKRFRAAVTGQPFYSEMGNGDMQTLYFGKRPNLIRIYDKQAEYRHQYRNIIRNLGNGIEPPTFESIFGDSNPDSILTRVERQIGGRIPVEIGTLRQVIEPGFEFKPFAKLRIIDHAPMPIPAPGLSFEFRSTGLYLQNLGRNDGMQAANAYIAKYGNGNASRIREKYRSFLAAASGPGISESELQARFEESLARQMFA